MPVNSAIFQNLIGQGHVSRVLGAAISDRRPSHAYLLYGPQGVGKKVAAMAFAAALCCREGGCGVCPSCRKASRGTNPDISLVAPVGSVITIDQVREINRSLNLHPSESEARVFVITAADAFNSESANAFLKTLEEPPDFVHFLLLAGRTDQVLPTIVSRCQEVRFKTIAPAAIEDRLLANFDVSDTMAQTYARVSGGNLVLAEAYCQDAGLIEKRKRYIEIAVGLQRGETEPHQSAAMLLEAADAAAGGAVGEGAQPPEGFDNTSKQQIQRDAHRRETAVRKRELDDALGIIQLWFRDMMVMAAGAGEVVMNRDYELELEQEALASRMDIYRQAAETVGATRANLSYNIDLELALQAMFHQLREVL